MAEEIERKFLVAGEGWRRAAAGSRSMRQFYLARGERATVRVRLTEGHPARLTVKGEGGVSRPEFEWEIPETDAREMEALATGRVIAKTRHLVSHGGFTWEVDVFEDGLVLAEIELPAVDTPFERPDWAGEEVTGDPRYFNAAMAMGVER